MKILAVDTCVNSCSVALVADSKTAAEIQDNRQSTQAEKLVPYIEEVLDRTGFKYDDLDFLAVTIGPGSFTGVRIGLAAVKGIALAINKKIIGANTLETLAWQIRNQAGNRKIISVINAMRGQVYIQKFSFSTESQKFNHENQPELVDIKDIASLIKPEGTIICSNCPEIISDAINGNNIEITGKILPFASDIAYLAEYKISSGEVPSDDPLPLYIRKPDAKLPGNIAVNG